jgi:hypothetical protein
VLPDGKVKTKEALARSAELKVQREAQAKADKEAEEAWNTSKGYAKAGKGSYITKAKEEGKPEAVALREWEAHLELASQDGPNTSDRARYVQVVNKFGRLVNQKISKKQMRKREQLEPKPVPPRPVIPEGIPMLEGETNLVALWDITDQEILRRLADQKKQKSQASKDLRKVQKEQKKFNRALKLMKKQAANAGVLWDPERAKRVILGLEPAYLPEESDEEKAESESSLDDSSSDSDSDSDSDSEDKIDGTTNGEKSKKKKRSDSTSGNEKAPLTKKKKKMANPPRPKLDLSLLEKAAEIERERAEKKREARLRRRKERKDAAEKKERELEELRAKEKAEQAKKANAVAKGEVYVADKAESKKRKRELETEDVLRDKENAKKLKREQKIAAREEAKALREKEAQLEAERLKSAEEAEAVEEKKAKKEKRDKKDKKQKLVESNDSKLDREIAERERKLREQNAKVNGDEDVMDGVEESKPRYMNSTQHWNTMHLSGGPERQDKFARLLGAKKEEKMLSPEDEAKEKKKAKKRAREAEKAEETKAAELAKVQRDLEMQYEAGMKLKHDGGSKRRGLGA